jgi:hypothetical protein
MSRCIKTSLVLAVASALVAVVATGASAKRNRPSCYRGGAILVQAESTTRIVHFKHKPGRRGDDALLACWEPTGRRHKIVPEVFVGTQLEVVEGRWVGGLVTRDTAKANGGATLSTTAFVYDAELQKTVHRSTACNDSPHRVGGDAFVGVDSVAFLPYGGMAFACDRLLLFRDRTAYAPEELEPPGTPILSVAFSRYHRVARLFWTIERDPPVTKSIRL